MKAMLNYAIEIIKMLQFIISEDFPEIQEVEQSIFCWLALSFPPRVIVLLQHTGIRPTPSPTPEAAVGLRVGTVLSVDVGGWTAARGIAATTHRPNDALVDRI